MWKFGLLGGIALAAAIMAGRPFSPYFDPMLFWLGKAAGPTWASSRALFHGTSVAITFALLLVASLPAFLVRLAARRWLGGVWQALIWCLGTIAIAWPALRIAAGIEE